MLKTAPPKEDIKSQYDLKSKGSHRKSSPMSRISSSGIRLRIGLFNIGDRWISYPMTDPCMVYLPTIWLSFMVNVRKYTVLYGIVNYDRCSPWCFVARRWLVGKYISLEQIVRYPNQVKESGIQRQRNTSTFLSSMPNECCLCVCFR